MPGSSFNCCGNSTAVCVAGGWVGGGVSQCLRIRIPGLTALGWEYIMCLGDHWMNTGLFEEMMGIWKFKTYVYMVAYYQCLYQSSMQYLTLTRDHCILFGFRTMNEILNFLKSSHMVRAGLMNSSKTK